MDERAAVVRAVVDRLLSREIGHPLRVGIDGVCGSGKSTFARELVRDIASRARPAVHVDSDGFHHLRAVRHRSTSDLARGYYDDAYDFASLVERVLDPLGPQGSRVYATKLHDLATDEVETDLVAEAPADAVVVFDCTFLQRGELRHRWDEVIFLDVARDAALARGAARDADALGGPAAARAAYEARYMAACDIYLREENPVARASILIDNTDVQRPVLVRSDPDIYPGSVLPD